MFCCSRSQACSFDWRGEIQVLPYIGSGCLGVTKSEIPVTKHRPLCGSSAESSGAKCVVSGRLPAMQAWLGFCWGSSEPAQITHFSVWNTLFSKLSFLRFVNTAYLCTKSVVWYIFLPIVSPFEQPTVTTVLGGAGGCWRPLLLWKKWSHATAGAGQAVHLRVLTGVRACMYLGYLSITGCIQTSVLQALFHFDLNPVFFILMKILSA